jgi:hypothetical protein
MILVFVKGLEELGRFESSGTLKVGDHVRLDSKVFQVKDVIYEFFGSNSRHLVEVQVEDLRV